MQSSNPSRVPKQPLRVVALIVGDPGPTELWTLSHLAAAPCQLEIVRSRKTATQSLSNQLSKSIQRYGLWATFSRLIGSKVIGRWVQPREKEELRRLFGAERLLEWWQNAKLPCHDVEELNAEPTYAVVTQLKPDLIIRVSGGILKPGLFELARIATLNIHHGIAPRIRGMWSIPWGIVESRKDWIGATIHVIDKGIDTGTVFSRVSPQVSPGDTGSQLFFRAHVEVVDELVSIVRKYAENPGQSMAMNLGPEVSDYRSAPGLGTWLKYLLMGRGRKAPATLESAWK